MWLFGNQGWSTASTTPTTATGSVTSPIYSIYNNQTATTAYYNSGFQNQTSATTQGLGIIMPVWVRWSQPPVQWEEPMGHIPEPVERFADVRAGEYQQLAQARQAMAAPAILRRREPTPGDLRATELLLSLLTDEQRQSYRQHGWFIVVGGSTGRRYRIRCNSYQGNVDLLAANDNNRIEYRFCGHCRDRIPLGDHLLAQKIMLEIDETAFIGLANRSAA